MFDEFKTYFFIPTNNMCIIRINKIALLNVIDFSTGCSHLSLQSTSFKKLTESFNRVKKIEEENG